MRSNNSLKIAIICSSFFPVIDGVTIAVFNRVQQLSRLGHQVKVFCPDYSQIERIYPDYKKYTGYIFSEVEIINLPSNQGFFLEFERDVTIESYRIVTENLEQFQPDIIHVDEPERLSFCWLKLPGVKYAKQHHIPGVAWFHTNYIDYFDDYSNLPPIVNKLVKSIFKLIFAKIYNAYDLTLVSSSITAEKVKAIGIKNTLYAELLGCNLDRYQNIQKSAGFFSEQYNLPNIDRQLKVIFIGRLTPDKGWNFALKALSNLPAKIRDRLAIIIVGDGTLKSEIERSLKQLTPHVYLLGRIAPEAVPELLTNGDIFITNSEKETRGLTVIEAAAAGIPAIAPRAGGIIDTIGDRETGFLYQPQNEADFIDKLTLLVEDNNLRQSMGTKARESARQWSWSEAVDRLVEIWQQEIIKKSSNKHDLI